MSRPALLLTSALLITLLGACSLLPAEEEPEAPAGLLEVDRNRFDARLITTPPERVVFDIPYRTRNSTRDTLYLTGCLKPDPPLLEKRVDGEWVPAYREVRLLCWSPPWVLAPGEVRRDTARVEGFLPGQNIGQVFHTSIEGTYRLKREIYAGLTDEKYPLGKDTLSVDRRVSNTFEVERTEVE